jgi:hypothetical protein
LSLVEIPNVQVSDTTGDDSSNTAKAKNKKAAEIFSSFFINKLL